MADDLSKAVTTPIPTAGAVQPEKPIDQLKEVERLMYAATKNKASDLHLKAGQKPILRVNTVEPLIRGTGRTGGRQPDDVLPLRREANDLRLQIKLHSHRARSSDLAAGTEHLTIV